MDIKSTDISFKSKIAAIPATKFISSKKVPLKDLNLNGFTALIGGDVFEHSGRIAKHDLLFLDKKLVAIDDFNPDIINSAVIKYSDVKNHTITPAIVDQHIHGGYGISFHTAGEDEIRLLLRNLRADGTGAVVATTLPGTFEALRKQIKVLNRVIENPQEGEAKILGIHMEGPFLNPKKAGVHDNISFPLPSVENFNKFEPKSVSIVTLAPELDKDYELSKYLIRNGVIPSAGHTMASADDIEKSGIKQVTHLFNAMAPFHHRTATVANEGLLNPEITAEVIGEKTHLATSVFNMVLNEKPADKIVLISDALPEAGIKKDFFMNGKLIHVDDDLIPRDENGVLAGSMKFLHNLADELVKRTRMAFTDFIQYASVNPAKNLDVYDKFIIKTGSSPNFTIWNNAPLTAEKTFVNFY